MSVALDGVRFSYNCSWSLGPVSLEIQTGETVAVVGPNGAGKTTLLEILAGLRTPAEGRLRFGGRAMGELSVREVAQKIAYAAQEHRSPLGLSVEDTVALGRAAHRGWFAPLTDADWREVNNAIEIMGLGSYRKNRSDELSTGEHRRMVIARALAQNPEILFLDEPTAHLDLRYQVGLLSLLDGLAHREGVAVVLTLHDLNEAARVADRVVLLEDGRVVSVGSAASVLTAENIERAYGIPVDVREHPQSKRPWVVPLSTRSSGR